MSRTRSMQEIHAPRRRTQTWREVMAKLQREMKRRAIADGHILDPSTAAPKWDWHWFLDGKGGILHANTRGEARSQIKSVLGIKDRLPTHIKIVRVQPDANRSTGIIPSP